MTNKKDQFEIEGRVTEVLPNTQFKVKLENGHEVIAYLGGKMRRFRIRTVLGDKVKVQMTTYDLTKGRIIERL